MPDFLISADSHVTVKHEDVKSHLAAKHHDEYDAAVARFQQEMYEAMGVGQANARGAVQPDTRRKASGESLAAAAGRPGNSEPKARLADMDVDGVDIEVLYSEVSAFRYLYFLDHGWREASRAFNDTLSEFASADPKRLLVSYQLPIHDVDHAVAEVKRVVGEGAKSLQIPVFPAELGRPDYYHEEYDPLWATIQETGLPICMHTGLNTSLNSLARRDPTPHRGIMTLQVPLTSAEALGMWCMTGVLERFPDLKLVFVETTLGWVPWWLFFADHMVKVQGYEYPNLEEELPSFYFHRNIWLTSIDEAPALHHTREKIGADNGLWSSDYPHPVSSWPNSRAVVDEQFKGVPADERALILSGNAKRVWNL